MPRSTVPSPASLLAFLTRRTAALTAVLTLIGAGAGYLAAGVVPQEHSATATILLNPLEGNAYRPGGSGENLINLTTEAQVVRSDKMNAEVAQALGWATEPSALAGALAVSVQTNTQILSLTFTDPSAERAAEGAQTYAETYLTFRNERATTSIDRDRQIIQEQVAALQAELDGLAAQISQAGNTSDATVLTARVQTLTTQISQLTAQLADLSTTTLDPGQVVVNATLAAANPLAGPLVLAAVGGLAGLVAGLALAFLLSRRSKVIKGTGEVALVRQNPVAVLKGASDLSPWTDDVPPEIFEARSAVLSALAAQARRTVLVAAVQPGTPLSSISLARAMGRTGLRVALVDTTTALLPPDLVDGELTTLVDLMADATGPVLTLADGGDGVWMLPTGALPDRSSLALRGRAVEDAIRRLLTDFDVLVLHADRVESDVGRTLSAVAQHVVIEVHTGLSRTTDLLAAAQAASLSGAAVIGVVVVGPGRSSARWAWPEDEPAEPHAQPRAEHRREPENTTEPGSRNDDEAVPVRAAAERGGAKTAFEAVIRPGKTAE